ncbi:MAG: RidA family protein [Clostridiales bacterium]|nr:RidA family protein [Clostridiales bacterium]
MLKKLHTSNAPEAIGPYSQAIVYNDTLFTSGQIAINPQTGNVESDTIEGQTEQVMKNLSAILNEAGTSFENVIKTTCFLKNMSDFAAFNGVYGQYFTSKPARSCVAAKELPKDVLVEVELIAAINK